MDGLMLQREVPGNEVGAHRHDHPPGQPSVEPDQEYPGAIEDQGDQPGRSVDLEILLLQEMHGWLSRASLPSTASSCERRLHSSKGRMDAGREAMLMPIAGGGLEIGPQCIIRIRIRVHEF